ncbi:MAG: hypothetical protein HRT68_16805, partial [Flavobacteriaceae bacterium]|nr:hypothetical protein [Flavobacteriaceae bacterium]
KDEKVLIAGDFNCKVGDVIEGNREEVSKSGKMLLKMVKEEQLAKDIPLKPKRRVNFKWFNVAAAVLIAGYFGYNEYMDYKREKLYQQTKEALFFVSENFNNGTKNLVHFSEFEKSKNKIFK